MVPTRPTAELVDGAAREAAIAGERRDIIKDFYGDVLLLGEPGAGS